MFGLSPWELLIVFLAILLLFGARRLPEIGSSLGKGIREFLLLNPLLHMIEWLRSAFFVEFESAYASVEYALAGALVSAFLGLVMLRGLGKRILAAV